MLRHLGASVFEIPKLLKDLDPEQIETHTAIFSRHVAAAERHIDDVRWLERFLYFQDWSLRLEDELIPQLPWPDADLSKYSLSPRLTGADTAVARDIAGRSPFGTTRDLARFVLLALGDTTDLAETSNRFYTHDPKLEAEAALQLSHWRCIFISGTGVSQHDLVKALKASPLPEHAGPRLAVLTKEPPDYPPSTHPDTAFLDAIAKANATALEHAAKSPDADQRYVAAKILLRNGRVAPVGPVLEQADPHYQLELLRECVRLKKPVTQIHSVLFHLVADGRDERVRDTAARALTFGSKHSEALRLAKLGTTRGDVIHALLLANFAPETFFEIGEHLVRNEAMFADRFGWDSAANPAKMPAHFVETVFSSASPNMQVELVRFAEKQVEARRDEPNTAIERFLIRTCLANLPVPVAAGAWASMHRITMHRNYGSTNPCELTLENARWCWEIPELLENLAAALKNAALQDQTFVREDLSRFIHSATPEFFAEAAKHPNACRKLIQLADADPQEYSYLKSFGNDLRGALAACAL